MRDALVAARLFWRAGDRNVLQNCLIISCRRNAAFDSNVFESEDKNVFALVQQFSK